MTASEAIHLHESKLLADSDFSILADSRVNPTQRQVYHLYERWRYQNFGSIADPFIKLKEKLSCYESQGAIVKYNDDQPWSILIITPVMLRAHEELAGSEMVFVDSTSGCEASGSTFTVFVTATKAGGIPLAIFLHPFQTTESYLKAFTLLKQTSPTCFGGKESPAIFMTDDSIAEKSALENIWPLAQQLLCHFHVAQAEWRWLMSNSSDVPKEERPNVMALFQAVMYAKTEEEVNQVLPKITSLPYLNFISRFKKFFERQKEWLTLHRLNIPTRNNNTNNFCEASIRIIKDVVLSRTKAFNVVALCDFSVNVFNNYLVNRLLKHSYNRVASHSLLYEDLKVKTKNLSISDIIQVNEGVYLVPSTSDARLRYMIHAEIGYCTCLIGQTGAFCKHQCFLMHCFKIKLPNAPVLTDEDRYNLAKLALGTNCPPPSFFISFDKKENFSEVQSSVLTESSVHFPEHVHSDSSVHFPEHMHSVLSTVDTPAEVREEESEYASASDKKFFASVIDKVMLYDIRKQGLYRFANDLLKTNNNNINEQIFRYNAVSNVRRKKRILAQPSSIARRRVGVTRRQKPIPAGRPTKQTKKPKRKHNLNLNIQNNQANPKN